MSWGVINSIGLSISLLGVVLLFRFGIPYHIDMGGQVILVDDGEPDPKELKKGSQYKAFGWIGLALIIAGTAVQIWVSLKTL